MRVNANDENSPERTSGTMDLHEEAVEEGRDNARQESDGGGVVGKDEDEESTQIRERRNLLAETVSHVVNPVIDCVDIEGVSRRIDVTELSQRIDVADISRRVDVEHIVRRINLMEDVIDRIDWNEILLERVDLNRVLDRIDVQRVVHRSNINSIVAQSSKIRLSLFMDGQDVLYCKC